ncbi:MAG: S46 family peptidase [Flavobacteriaceae bacterium]|nr:S46 family peptidase [Flavobacteriaceae bacterium]
MRYLALFLFFVGQFLTAQQGGMWIPSLLEGLNEKEMVQLGSKLTAKDIYDINNSSLKDAVIHFNGGCTGEIISDQGLILTNHHCGYDAIQSHSSLEKDYLQHGFWATDLAGELPNPGMYVTFIKRIDEVTAAILSGIENNMTASQKQALIDKNIAAVIKTAVKEEWQDIRIRPMYDGNKYYLFVTENFNDIRMVGAPPSSIGKFGSDTDNWMWPRHTGDFSLFRIYADKNNRPAVYSKDNVPFKPLHFLPVSLDGVQEDDFTMVFGFPGRTNEYLPAIAIEQLVNQQNPAKIELRDEALKTADRYMRADNAIKIKYASKYASTANYWKKWIGENQGLKQTDAIGKKKILEAGFQKKVQNNPEYRDLLKQFDQYYSEIEELALAQAYWNEVVNRNIELLFLTTKMYQFEKNVTKNPEKFEEERAKLRTYLDGFYKNFEPKVDKEVFYKLMSKYVAKSPKQYQIKEPGLTNIQNLTDRVYANSGLTSQVVALQIVSGTQEEVMNKLNSDEAYILGKKLAENYYQNIQPNYQSIMLNITEVQKKYMKALMETFPEQRFFPDANSTLRVTYGKVKGYYPKDAVIYQPISYLDGVMEKYIPGDYEFDVPEKLKQLYLAKDYGPYGENGKMPVNFIGTNHTTGGNSGSPAIDAHGNLIGLNFDRVWEGTMSDYYYDPAICRNIMVDARYILFIIDKYAGSTRLIKEMKLVHPKKQNAGKK